MYSAQNNVLIIIYNVIRNQNPGTRVNLHKSKMPPLNGNSRYFELYYFMVSERCQFITVSLWKTTARRDIPKYCNVLIPTKWPLQTMINKFSLSNYNKYSNYVPHPFFRSMHDIIALSKFYLYILAVLYINL